MQAGAWETRAELSFIESHFATAQHNVYEAWANTNPQSIKIISSTDDERLAELKTQELVTDSMRLDLERGYHISVNSESPDTWWRIDTSTGEVLGIGPNGYGQVTVEHISLVHSVVFGGLGVMVCLQGGASLMCCLAFGLFGFALGLVLGALIAGPAAAGGTMTGRQTAAFFFGQQWDAAGIMVPVPCGE